MTNLKKASIVSIFVLLIIAGIALVSLAGNSGTVIKEAKLRKMADNTSIVLEIIPKKEKVEILAEEGDWYQVRYNKIKGYVQKDFIETEKTNQTNTIKENEQTNQNQEKIQNNVTTDGTITRRRSKKRRKHYFKK